MFILIIFLIIYAIIVWKNINWGVYLILFALPSYMIRFNFIVPWTLLETMILILFGIFFIKNYSKLFRNQVVKLYKWPILLIWVSGIISVIHSPQTFQALGIFKAYLLEPILFFVVASSVIKNKKQFKNSIIALVCGAFIFAIYAIMQKITGYGIPHPWNLNREFRVTSFFPYPNALALYLSPILVLLFGAIVNLFEKLYIKILAFLVFIILFIALLFTKSAGGIASVIIAFVFFLFFILKHKIIFLLSMVLLLGGLFFLNPNIYSKIYKEVALKGESGKTRILIWSSSIKILKKNMFFGTGLAGFEPIFEAYRSKGYREKVLYPHNIILNFWLELGILGLIGFVWAVVIMLRQNFAMVFKENKISLIFLSAFFAILIFGLVDVPFFKNDLSVLWWFLFIPHKTLV